MMPEQNVLIGRDVIRAVVATVSGSWARRVDPEHLVCDEQAIQAICDEVGAHRRDDEPRRVDGLTAIKGNDAQGGRAEDNDDDPNEPSERTVAHHVSSDGQLGPHRLLQQSSALDLCAERLAVRIAMSETLP
jgi:hypothetical protein